MADSRGKQQANGLQTSPIPNKLTTLKQTWQENTLAPVVRRFPERKEAFHDQQPLHRHPASLLTLRGGNDREKRRRLHAETRLPR